MKRKIKIVALMIMLFMALAVGSYSTYAFLTDTEDFTLIYTIGQINGTVTVTGDAVVDSTVTNSDLAYIHYTDDFVLNEYGLLDTMSSEIKINIKFNNDFPTRVKVKVPSLTTKSGLLYIVIDDTDATVNQEVKLQVVDGTLQYGYANADGTVTTWNNCITGLVDTLDNATFRGKVDEYNTSKLAALYQNNLFAKGQEGNFKFRILIWGDYYSLSDDDKASYLDKQYELEITAKVIQAIDQYGGTLSYEND